MATLELSMEFPSFDDYWQPFLGGSTPTSAFAAAINSQSGGALTRVIREKIPRVSPTGPLSFLHGLGLSKGTSKVQAVNERVLLRAAKSTGRKNLF